MSGQPVTPPGSRPAKPLSPAHVVLGQSMDRRRKRLGLKWAEIAKAASINPTSMSFIHKGRQDVSLSQLVGLAAALKTTVARLVASLNSLHV